MKQKRGLPGARKQAGPPVYVLFVRDADGLTCGVRCPPWEDARQVFEHSTPTPGRYTGEVLTAREWAARCEVWGGTLPLYGYWEAVGLRE